MTLTYMTKPKEEKKETVKFDRGKKYAVEEALKIIRSGRKAKFDESLELHANLGIDPKKGEEQVRGTVVLPHGTGKSLRIAIFTTETNQKEAREAGADIVGGEELINEIKQKGKIDFDLALATPEMMPKMAAIAKTLGPKGLMPSPKNETIVTKIAPAILQLKKGKIVFKNDDTGNVHTAVGKLSFDDDKLLENIRAFLSALKKAKPATSKGIFIRNLVLSTTMGPGIKLEV